MSDYYVDHGAYPTAIGATPTWGVPQEGDGSSKDAATTSSIASIAFGSVPTTGTFSCCGVSISTTGVIGAASADAAANTLASNINAVSTAVAAGVAVGTPQLRNLVYARGPSNGAPAGTCQIMMRIGSDKLNYATNSNAAIASTFDGTPTLTQFAGGSGGCWGYLLNATAMGVSSSIAALAYGVMFFQPYVWTATVTVEDIIWARTGTGKTITYSASSVSVSRSCAWSMRVLFDTNIKWTGDSGTGVVLFDMTGTAGSSSSKLIFCTGGTYDVTIAAVAQGGVKFRLFANNLNHTFYFGYQYNTADVSFINVDIEDLGTSGTAGVNFHSDQFGVLLFRGCRYSRPTAQASIRPALTYGGYFATYIRFEGCAFTWNINGVADPGPVINSIGTVNTAASLTFDGCSFSGWASGGDKFTLMPAASATNTMQVQAINCTGLKLSATYSGLIQTTNVTSADPALAAGYAMQSGDSAQFRYEQRNGLIEWDAVASPAYPTLSAVQLDGSTPWSVKAVWMNNGEVTQSNDFKIVVPSLIYRAAAATKTITLEMFCRSAMVAAVDRLKVALLVTYINNATGKAVTETLMAAPSSSAASWTGAGSWSGYAAYKLALTTANAIKQNTEVKVQLRLHGKPNAGQNEAIFIDPEFGMA